MMKVDNGKDVNIIVISDSGKLIFSRFDEHFCSIDENDNSYEEYLCYISGLIQGMRSAIAQDDDLDCGEMQYINAHKSKILFMTVGCITMVAIVQNDKDCYSEAFLKIQLEYVYTGIIFTLTDSIQYMINENPYLDIRDMLGSTSNILRDVLDNLESLKVDRPCLFLGGVQSFPISHDIRNHTSKILSKICSRHKSIIYGIISIDKKLISIIQPHAKHYQLQSIDLNILLHIISSQTQTIDNEQWFPVCIPTLSQSGFVHAYQCCLGMISLKLTIISQDPTIEEFGQLRELAAEIRIELGLSQTEESILRIYRLNHNHENSVTDDELLWERSKLSDEKRERKNVRAGSFVDDSETLIEAHTLGYHLLQAVKKEEETITTYQEYLNSIIQKHDIATISHFLFRYSAAIQHHKSGAVSDGSLTQCYCLSHSQNDLITKKQVWHVYEQLRLDLRLNLKSSQADIDIFHTNYKSGINEHRPSQLLHEYTCTPQDAGLIYVKKGEELFVGLQKGNYELYLYFKNDISPLKAYKLSQLLMESLLIDVNDLFDCRPQSI